MAKNIPIVLSLSVVGKPSAGGNVGVGKSSLCNRLMRRDLDDFTPDKHKSTISQTDFVSPVINQDHFLYWGQITFQDEDCLLSMQILEHTEFTEDSTLRSFNATQNYIKRCTQLKFTSPGKMKYINCDQIAIPDEFEKEQCPNKVNIDGFIFVFDVSLGKISEQESQKKYAERLLPILVATKKPIVFVASKCDNLDRDMLNYLIQLSTKRKTYPVVETSMFKGINLDIPFLLMANQVTKKFSNVKNLTYSDALVTYDQAINEMVLSFQRFIDIEVTNFRLKVAQIIPKIKSDAIFVRLSRECGSQKPRGMISQHLRKLREDVEQVRSKEFLEKIMLALKSCLPNVPNDKYTIDQCIQDIEKSEDFGIHFVKLTPGVHWVDVADEENRISFGFLRTQSAKEFLLQYKERLAYKLQVRLMTEEFESAIASAKYIVPGLPLEKALMQLPLGANWSKLDRSLKKQIYDNMQENLFRCARSGYISMLMENVSSLVEYREDEDDYMFTSNELKNETLKNDARFHNFDFLPDKRTEIEFNFLATLNLPKGDFKISQISESLKFLAPTLDEMRITDDRLFSITFESEFNVAILGNPEYIGDLKEDYIKATADEKFEECMMAWEKISFETFDFTKGQSSNTLFQPNACVCFISKLEDIELIETMLKMLFIPDILHDTELQIDEDSRWFVKARSTKLWGIPLVIIATTKEIEDSDDIDKIHKDGQFLADSVQSAFICDSTTDPDLNLLTYNSIHLTLKCLITTMKQRTSILKERDTPFNAELSVAVLSLPDDKFKTGQVLIPFLQNQMNWMECYQNDYKILFDSVLNYNTRITISSSFFTVFNYNDIRSETRHGFMFIFSVENKAAWEICRLFTHRYMKLAPVLLIAMLGDLKTNKLTRNAEELLHEARTFAMHYKLHLIGTSQSTWKAGSFAPFLDTIWNNRFSSALNQKKANPKQPVTPNMRPALPKLPSLPPDTDLKAISRSDLKVTPRKASLAGPNERNMRRLHGSQEIILDISGADQPRMQLSDSEFVESGDEDNNIVEESYDTLDSVPSDFEPNVRYKENIRIEEMIYMPPTDVENSEIPENLDLIYDTLESVPPQRPDQRQADSSLWKPRNKTSLVPLIQIPTISTMGKQISSTYSMLSVDEPDIEPDVSESKARPESCYSLLNASEIEDNTVRPQFPLPPIANIPECPKNSEEGNLSSEKPKPLPITLPEYTEIDANANESIEEVIYNEGLLVNRSNLNIADYEDPSSLTLPPPSRPLNLSDIKNEDFPSYDSTFQFNDKPLQETTSEEYSQIVFPKSFINHNSNSQPMSEYDILNDAQEVAQQSESLDIFMKETSRLQHLMSLDSDIHEKDEQKDMETMKAELDQHLAEFSDIRDLDVSLQFNSPPPTEQENPESTLIVEDLYACPQKVSGQKEPEISFEDSIPSVEDIYAGVEPPPLPVSSVNLAEDFEDTDPSLPPPPPRTYSLNNKLTALKPKFPEPISSSNSSNDYQTISKVREIAEVDYSTVYATNNPEILHTTSLEYPEEPKKRTLSKREKKDIEKAEKVKQKSERRSTKESMKRTKSQSSVTKSSFSVAEESFTYFCQPLDFVIPPHKNIPVFLEQCVNAIEGMSPIGMESEGIYRVPANQEDMINLINQFEANPSVHLTHYTQSVYTLAGTLKCFFQKLPDPLISEESAANLLKITDVKSKAGKAKLKDALSRISPKSYSVLEYLILHLHKVSLLSDENKMTARNLAITFWPSLFRPPVDLTAFQISAPIYEQMLSNMIEFPSILPTDDIIKEDLYDSVRVSPK